jgi:hypothetical protein
MGLPPALPLANAKPSAIDAALAELRRHHPEAHAQRALAVAMLKVAPPCLAPSVKRRADARRYPRPILPADALAALLLAVARRALQDAQARARGLAPPGGGSPNSGPSGKAARGSQC